MTIDPTNLVAGIAAVVVLPAFVAYRFGRASQRQADVAAIDVAMQEAWASSEEAKASLACARQSHEIAEAWKRQAMENDGALRLRDGSVVGHN